ncbi:MAG: cadherin repeat domain-containing protein, partial [Gammaproteobacteria bacterium]
MAGTSTLNGEAGWITTAFVVSIIDIDDDGINNKKTAWDGSQSTGTAIAEDPNFNSSFSGAEGGQPAVAIATFAASDEDGDQFEYDVQLEGADTNLFSIDSDGVLYTTGRFDYEGRLLAVIDHKYDLYLYVRGTSGGTPTGPAVSDTITLNGEAGWISTNFVISITDVNEYKTAWSGTQPTIATVNEDTTIAADKNFKDDLTPVALATFAVSDADGNQFEYDVRKSGSSVYNNYLNTQFSMDGNGVLYTTGGFNYEGFLIGGSFDNQLSFTIYARGTSSGDPVGPAVSGTSTLDGEAGWITRDFVLSIANVVESSDADGGTSIFVGDDNVVFSNVNYTNDDGTTQTPLTADNFENSFISFTDADSNQNQHHWYFIADDANDGTGYIVFDVDGDGAGND